MEIILLDTMFELPSLEGVEEVVISKQVVEGTAPPLYIYADRSDRTGNAERLSPASTDGQGSYPFSWPAARQGRPSFGDYRERSPKCGVATVRVGPVEQVLQHAAPLRAPAKKR